MFKKNAFSKPVSKLLTALLCIAMVIAIAPKPISKANWNPATGTLVIDSAVTAGDLETAVTAAINPDLPTAVTALSFSAGSELDSADFTYIRNSLTNLQTLDLTNCINTALPTNALNGHSAIQTVTLPTTVTTIGSDAFYGCPSLTSINLGSVTTIGEAAFQACTSLGAVDLSGVTTLGDNAFSHCANLTIANGGALNAGLTTIPDHAFNGCDSIDQINLSNVTTIGDNAFNNCYVLGEVNLGQLTSLGEYAFSSCNSLTIANGGALNASLTTIPDHAFYECTSLTQIDFSNVTSIGSQTFAQCEALGEVDLSNVTTVGEAAFAECYSLTLKDDLIGATTISNIAFYECTSLERIDLSNVTSVGRGAFAESTKLYDIGSWHPSVTINQYTFRNCALDFSTGYYPTGYNDSNITDIAENQTPKLFFSLNPSSQTINAGESYNTQPYQLKTFYGTNYADIIGASWVDPAVTDVPTVNSIPPSVDTSVAGTYQIKYWIDAGVYADFHEQEFALTVLAAPTPAPQPAADGTTAATTADSTGSTGSATGDPSPIGLLAVALVASIVAGLAIYSKRKKASK